METNGKLCPSSKLSKGAYLLGIKNEENKIDILSEPVKVDGELLEKFNTHDTKAEKALRFTNKCVQSGCKQWTGEKCGVIDNILEKVEEKYIEDNLPDCAIRSTCRWYFQEGASACKVCTLVTTYVEDPTDDKFLTY